MRHAIYPPIGFARLGDSPSHFFIGPETVDSPGIELNGGAEHSVKEYKDSNLRIKRQGARFRIFEFPDDGTPPRLVSLPAGSEIEWTVHLVNRKQAVIRNGPPATPVRPQSIPTPGPSTIDPGPRSVRGSAAAPVLFDTGTFQGRGVPLGEIQTDGQQNLIVLGGRGFSSSVINPPDIQNFYNNPGWHDDTADGPVTARIRLPNNQVLNDIDPAWVAIGPPDFAPDIRGVVTLFDIIFQVGVEHFGLVPPAQPSFTHDIFPILFRTRQYRWVNSDPNWTDVSDDWVRLANSVAANRSFRDANREVVLNVESVLSRYRLTATQKAVLQRWVEGTFISDWQGLPQPNTVLTPEGLTRASLDGTVGQGFFPGIEAGNILRDRSIYKTPFNFRIDHTSVSPGDLTALMAVPWQADFWDCARSWWPSQRPDDVRRSVGSPDVVAWDRGITGHLSMVSNFAKLGFVTPVVDGDGDTIYVETQRDTTFV